MPFGSYNSPNGFFSTYRINDQHQERCNEKAGQLATSLPIFIPPVQKPEWKINQLTKGGMVRQLEIIWEATGLQRTCYT